MGERQRPVFGRLNSGCLGQDVPVTPGARYGGEVRLRINITDNDYRLEGVDPFDDARQRGPTIDGLPL